MNNDDDLVLFTELDADLRPNQDHIELIDRVNSFIDVAIQKHDIAMASSACRSLVSAMKVAGIGLAAVLGKINKNWKVFGVSEDFNEYMAGVTGLHHRTIERYVRVYEMQDVIPEELRDRIMSKNIKNLIPIANALSQGYDVEPRVWEQIASAADFNEISQIVRDDIKEADPRASHLNLWLERDTGSMYAFKEDQRYYIGSLEVSDPDPVVQKAIKRIVDNAGFLS